MSTIKSIKAQEILDSTAIPTIETTVELDDGIKATSSVPSAAKTSAYEAIELRDTSLPHYRGEGVKKEVDSINTIIAASLVGQDISSQNKIDSILLALDGTPNKGHLGANTLLSVSQAVAKAAATSAHIPLWKYIQQLLPNKQNDTKLPTPIFCMLEGGRHGSTSVEFQEFLVIPASSKQFEESLEMGVEIYRSLKKFLIDHNASILTANQGGFSPMIASNLDGLNMLKIAIEQSTYKFNLDVFLGIDCSANDFKKDKAYFLKDKNGEITSDELINLYSEFIDEFSILYLEDPFSEDDWDGWKKLYSKVHEKLILVGDDLTATNPYRLQIALDHAVMNGLTIKPIQLGTITETIALVAIAQYKHLKVVVSDRSSDTTDNFIVDYAVGINADYVKFGAPVRERVNRYNRMLEINREMHIKK